MMGKYDSIFEQFRPYAIGAEDERPKPLDEPVLVEMESEIGLCLPEDYRALLLGLGGAGGLGFREGYVLFPLAEEPADGDSRSLDVLYAYGPGHHYHLPDEYRDKSGYLPEELIAIGDDGCGNHICLTVSGPQTGYVYFAAREERPEGEPESYEGLYLAARSFDDFVRSLRLEPYDEV